MPDGIVCLFEAAPERAGMIFAEAATWHYFAAAALFWILGAIGHVCRAVFNLLPDRLSDKPMMDMMLSDGYDWTDRVFGTEYDDAGYYQLDSAKNFQNSCVFTVLGGMGAMLFSSDFSGMMAWLIDAGIVWLWELWFIRLGEIRLI
ncbi:hypothetical protein [Pararhizobium sp.]|uniref:hypothetical protein n=1 Tax=Pararhizobium sp. TaxID=1977563 RepID=UPI00271C9E47|nr:hypothetical protein [Pararhizobium sp.]MDO9414801.1 hypothetical protein [Pararhizobium sp.]